MIHRRIVLARIAHIGVEIPAAMHQFDNLPAQLVLSFAFDTSVAGVRDDMFLFKEHVHQAIEP